MTSAPAGGERVCRYPLADWERTAPGAVRVLLLNLMPEKERTERDFIRTLAAAGCDTVLLPLRIPGVRYRNTPQEYVECNYLTTDSVAHASFDGLIITGAPLEQLPFGEVRYWERLCALMDWAGRHVASTLYICWGAQAGLWHHYGIDKCALPGKCFGIFAQENLAPGHPLTVGLGDTFAMPHSRHTGLDEAAAYRCPQLTALARGAESGLSIVCDDARRRVFVTGHLEYAADTLHREYTRDLAKGLPISPPQHYYKDGDPGAGADYTWDGSARIFYANWLRYCRAVSKGG